MMTVQSLFVFALTHFALMEFSQLLIFFPQHASDLGKKRLALQKKIYEALGKVSGCLSDPANAPASYW